MRRLLAVMLVTALLALPSSAHAAPTDPNACTFTLGFATLHDLIPQVVGDCTTNAVPQANGDVQQPTTGGLLVWRKADNWTAFTDGTNSWINGPCGLQSRPNDDLLGWEAGGPCQLPAGFSRFVGQWQVHFGGLNVEANGQARWAQRDYAASTYTFNINRVVFADVSGLTASGLILWVDDAGKITTRPASLTLGPFGSATLSFGTLDNPVPQDQATLCGPHFTGPAGYCGA